MSDGDWKAFTGKQVSSLPADAQQRTRQLVQREPIAEVTVRLFGLNKGQAEVQVQVAPSGPLAAARTTGSAHTAAYRALLAAVQREVQDALSHLGGI